jgi:hypothetical protein
MSNIRCSKNYTAPYAINPGRSSIDGACERWAGHSANTKLNADCSSSLRRSNDEIAFATRGNFRFKLKARKPIKIGEEIFVYYGDDYQIPESFKIYMS